MSFFKKVGETLKDTSKRVVTEVKKQQETFEKERKRKREYINLKQRILKDLTLSDMKKICKEFGVKEPSLYYEDPLSGKRVKKDETPRNLYLNHIIHNVYLDQLIEFSRKRKKSVSDIIKRKKEVDEEYNRESRYDLDSSSSAEYDEENDEYTQIEITRKKVNDLDLILEKIDQEFEFDRIRDENELEGLIVQFLKIHFKDKKIDRQYKTEKGTIDIGVDDKIGIEIKIAESNKVLENLEGQLLKYKRLFGEGKVGAIILKTSKISDEKLDEYLDIYQQNGIKTIILDKGRLRRRKSNVKTFKLVR